MVFVNDLADAAGDDSGADLTHAIKKADRSAVRMVFRLALAWGFAYLYGIANGIFKFCRGT